MERGTEWERMAVRREWEAMARERRTANRLAVGVLLVVVSVPLFLLAVAVPLETCLRGAGIAGADCTTAYPGAWAHLLVFGLGGVLAGVGVQLCSEALGDDTRRGRTPPP